MLYKMDWLLDCGTRIKHQLACNIFFFKHKPFESEFYTSCATIQHPIYFNGIFLTKNS